MKPRSLKKIIAAATSAAVLVALVVIGVASPASAHTASVSGTSACTTSTGASVVTWTVTNDWSTPATVTASNNPAIPVGSIIPAQFGITQGSKTFTQTVNTPSAGLTVTAGLSFSWPDYATTDSPVSVTVPNSCVAPPAPPTTPACITDSSVTYTYSNDDSNSGVITVPNTPSQSGALCTGFWVTATSWKFTTSTNLWPQNRDVVDKVNGGHEITTPGTYTFGAQITCGQGDIYASTSAADAAANPSSINPSATLSGPNGGFTEKFLSDWGFQSSFSGHTYHQDSSPSCYSPPPPLPACIPDSSVTYTYSNNDANSGVITVPNTPSQSGALCTGFWVTATSWKFTSNTTPWPQNRDVVDKVNGGAEITQPGAYTYAAAITCGQGDIYASPNASDAAANPSMINPSAVLTSQSNPFSEKFLSDWGFQALTNSPTYHQDSTSCFSPPPPLPACIPDSSVTYTYSSDDSNSGVITVPNTASQSGALCTGFWVTATSWKFTSPTDVWPQNRDVVDPVNGGAEITKPGIYTYAAAVTCGQGDIYASVHASDKSSNPSMLNPSATLTGPSNPFSEIFLSDWGFKALNNSPTYHQDSLACVPPPVVTAVAATCTYVNGASQADVSLVLDNTSSSSSSTFKVSGTTYSVNGGATRTIDVGPVSSAGTSFNVYINGSTTATAVPVAAFTTCIPVIPGDPLVVQQTCSAGAPVGGSVTVDLDPHLVYTITGPSGFTPVTPTVSPITNQNSGDYTLSGLGAGTYIVSVVPTTGYVLSGQAWWPLTVNMAPISCPTTPVTPTVNLTAATCGGPNPNVPVETEGVISVSLDSNVVYTLTDGTSNPGVILTSADTSEPDGIYTVTASLTPAAVIAGYVFPTGTQTSWPVSFFSACFPTLATWHSGAVGTAPVCTSSDEGTITLLHGPSLTDANSEPGEVNYSIENDATSVVTNVGATTSSVNVAPGDYTVIATPVDPSDGLSGNTGTTNQLVYHLTVAAATTICAVAHALAFTGGSIGVLGFLLAGGMLLLGAGLVLMRRGFGRTAQ